MKPYDLVERVSVQVNHVVSLLRPAGECAEAEAEAVREVGQIR